MASVESQVEWDLSTVVMSTKPEMVTVAEGERLITQGEPGSSIYLILDGMLKVDVDRVPVAELGPGAIVGERAILETGRATTTVTATTAVRAARIPVDDLDRSDLEEAAATHRHEDDH